MSKRWSTKNLHIVEAVTDARSGVGIFEFTDDYSVFHFSKMPDPIPAKGEAVARMAVFTLRMLADAGIPTHLLEFEPPKRMRFRLVRVIDPSQGLSPTDHNRLIPLQVIYRNQLPPGASVFRRLAAGSVTLEQLGLDAAPVPGQRLARPLIEFTTKLEEIDRFITPEAAQQLAGLSDEQFAELRSLTLRINALISARAEQVGLLHADGKFEFALDDRGQIMLVDTAGTPDENRFLYHGLHVSKQVLRDYYLVRGLEKDIQVWAAQGRPRAAWPKPEPLPQAYVHAATELYRSVCERWTGESVWGAPTLESCAQRFAALQPEAARPASASRRDRLSRSTELIIVGCMFGDEGKGRFTDVFARDAFAVVRYQAGPHTGHTVVQDGREYKFIQVPAGALRGTVGVLGNGCVIHPGELLDEIAALEAQGLRVELRISESAHVVFPHHRAQEQAIEQWRARAISATELATGLATGEGAIGSTCRGVGACREDRIARVGLRMVDLLDRELLFARLVRLLELKRRWIEKGLECSIEQLPGYRAQDWDGVALAREYHEYGRRLESTLTDVSSYLDDVRKQARLLVYEGAQSVGLDVEHGSYPFCSSGYSAAGGVTVGTGSPPGIPFEVYGVSKAYALRVGKGPLPTEVDGAVADHLVERGREYGTVTGRRRRVGWLDLVALKRSIRIDGVSRLCISGLDVLAGLPEVRVATHYLLDDVELGTWPTRQADWAKLRPVYTTMPGWPDTDWSAVARGGLAALHDNARAYLDFVIDRLGVELAAVSVGPERDAAILLSMPSVPGWRAEAVS